ncbi:adaptin n terminal region domain-containing protein [Cyclospora cayetanensis]|uniref:Adaptin n terminal region domain-containing protein n=1 Tax=Cyclospora cayetanensis TaxID=88456 RepID=A0A1D3D3Q0_9EIME|nr:adaptin n terminal region domain-containing protein [Cyclospora cayetanensis]
MPRIARIKDSFLPHISRRQLSLDVRQQWLLHKQQRLAPSCGSNGSTSGKLYPDKGRQQQHAQLRRVTVRRWEIPLKVSTATPTAKAVEAGRQLQHWLQLLPLRHQLRATASWSQAFPFGSRSLLSRRQPPAKMHNSSPHVSKEFFDLIKFIGEARSKQEEDRIIANEIVVLKERMSQPKVSTDLRSPNVLYAQAALQCVSRLLTLEMLPAVAAAATDLLQHPLGAIRRKAVMVLHRVITLRPPPPFLSPRSQPQLSSQPFQRQQPQQPEGAGSAEEDDYIIPDLLGKIRRALCDGDPSVMGVSLHLLRRLATTHRAQCTEFVASLVCILKQILDRKLPKDFEYHRVPAPWIQMSILSVLAKLVAGDARLSSEVYLVLEEAMRRADCTANVGFALVYSGLAALAGVAPTHAASHQLAIIDCLEDADDTLKHKTLNLLAVITNPSNVAFVVESLLQHLRTAADPHLRASLVSRVAMLAERRILAKSEVVRELCARVAGAQSLLQLVADGTDGTPQQDYEFRVYVVNALALLLRRKKQIPDILIQVASWVLGEFGSLCSLPDLSQRDLLALLRKAAQWTHESKATRGWLIWALAYARAAVAAGAAAYIPRSQREAAAVAVAAAAAPAVAPHSAAGAAQHHQPAHTAALNFTPYALPTAPQQPQSRPAAAPASSSTGLQRTVGAAVVEVIGKEAVAAGTAQEGPVYIHLSVDAPTATVHFRIKAASQSLADRVAAACSNL